MTYFQLTCDNCPNRIETTVGDIVLVHDLESDGQFVNWCMLYNQEIDEILKDKCFEQHNEKEL